MKVILYIIVMSIAIFLGEKNWCEKLFKNNIGKIQNILIIALLFLMGIIIGRKKEVIAALSTIGFKAFFMSCMVIIFSVVVVKIVMTIYKKYSKDGK